MAVKLTRRFKIALIVSGLLISVLSVAIIFDAFGIRSHTPTKEVENNYGARGSEVFVPPPENKLVNRPGSKSQVNPKGLKTNSSHLPASQDGETDSEASSDADSSHGGGGGGGGGFVVPEPLPLGVLKDIKLLFTVDTPVNINVEEAKIRESDFSNQLPDMPLRTSGFVGIQNKGNSCYADSTLQALYRIPFLRKVLANLDVYHRRAKIVAKEKADLVKTIIELDPNDKSSIGRLTMEIQNITDATSVLEGLNHMFHQLHTGTGPANFTYENSMQCMPGVFRGYAQEDAEEYFSVIMGYLKDFLPPSQHGHFTFDIVINSTEIDPKDPSYSFDRPEIREKQAKINLDLRPVLLDKDGKIIVQSEETLEGLFTRFFTDEIVDLVNLENGSKGQLRKKLKLENPPPILAIQLKRIIDFENNVKISSPVNMPMQYDFGKVIGGKNVGYKLKMIVEHIGSSGRGGHYVAHCLEADGKWYTYDDSGVGECHDINERAKRGYFYFYERDI